MRVDQLLVAAAAADPITVAALRLRDELRCVASSDVYALHVDESLASSVRPFHELSSSADGPVVLHWDDRAHEVVDWLLGATRPLVVEYHGAVEAGMPPEHEPTAASHPARDLAVLASRARVAIVDLPHHAVEVAEVGCRDVRIAGPVVAPDRLHALEPDPLMANHLTTMVEGPVVLSVGPMTPPSRFERLIAAYSILVSTHRADARLIVAGPSGDRDYARCLQQQLFELNLPGGWLAGAVRDDALAALLRRADVFVTLHEHDRIPHAVVDAFAFDVPVVAVDTPSVSEVACGAALLLGHDDGPEVIAEALALLIEDRSLRARLVDRGRQRLEELSGDRALRYRVELLTGVL